MPPREPVEARLAQLHNPYAAVLLPWESVRLRAEQRMVIVHHPPTDAEGVAYYDLDLVRRNAVEILSGSAVWAPVGPLVRQQLAGLASRPSLTKEDWHNVVEIGRWATQREPPTGERVTIGRHIGPIRANGRRPARRSSSLPGPSALGRAHPRRRALPAGAGRALPCQLEGRALRRRGTRAVPPLARLLRLPPSSSWVEAFGCTIAEAMASGLPILLPPLFEPLFQEGAIYTAPEDVMATVLRLADDPVAYRRHSDAAQAHAQRHFSHETHRRRLHALIGPPSVPRPAAALATAAGVAGLVQRRRHGPPDAAPGDRPPAAPPIEPVFVTMSQAMHVVSTFGYLAEYLPYHQYLGCDVGRWNKFLAQELRELIGFYDARVVVFDSNCPFQGVIDAADACRQAWFVWCRRGMWQAGVGAKFLAREKHFDFVIEPRDLADAFDVGLTPLQRERARLVAPIRLLDDHEWLPRDTARAELGLEPNQPAILVQLGSGNNFDYGALRRLVERLATRPGLQVVMAEWLMAERSLDPEQGVAVLRRSRSAAMSGRSTPASVPSATTRSTRPSRPACPASSCPMRARSRTTSWPAPGSPSGAGSAIACGPASPTACSRRWTGLLDPRAAAPHPRHRAGLSPGERRGRGRPAAWPSSP